MQLIIQLLISRLGLNLGKFLYRSTPWDHDVSQVTTPRCLMTSAVVSQILNGLACKSRFSIEHYLKHYVNKGSSSYWKLFTHCDSFRLYSTTWQIFSIGLSRACLKGMDWIVGELCSIAPSWGTRICPIQMNNSYVRITIQAIFHKVDANPGLEQSVPAVRAADIL